MKLPSQSISNRTLTPARARSHNASAKILPILSSWRM